MRPTAHKNTMQTTTDDGARDPEAVQLMPVHASGPLSPTAQHLAAVAKQPHQARWLTPEFLIYIGVSPGNTMRSWIRMHTTTQ